MKNKYIILAIIEIIIIAVLLTVIGVMTLQKNENTYTGTILKKEKGITIVPTMNDELNADSAWCGTFQLLWNDIKNNLVKKDIVFNPQIEMVKNLNKEDFDDTMLSEEYYYKTYGIKTLELKKQIEDGIKEKFNQTSDALDRIDWSEDALDNPGSLDERRYIFYTMLYRKFEYLKEFDKLKNGTFGKDYNDVKYFGIDSDTRESVRNQIKVLYYNSKYDFALLIKTKTNDEVIFCKNPIGNNFNEIYNNMNDKAKSYKGEKSFENIDEFKAPYIKFNELKEYKELADQKFKTADPNVEYAVINKAIQTIEFSLDEKGGEVKSEGVVDFTVDTFCVDPVNKKEPRYFYVDDTFVLFLREEGKPKPYLALRIEDITKVQ